MIGLTIKQAYAHEAGVPLDTLIATLLLGHEAKSVYGAPFERRPDRPWEEMPQYSTDANAAFEVLAAVHDKIPECKVWPRPFARPIIWHCKVGGIVCDGESVALAVCRAALASHLAYFSAPAVPEGV